MYLAIGWRNLWRNPRRTLIILTAIVIGIMSMLVISAFSRGMMEALVDNSIGNLVGYIRIEDPDHRIDPFIDFRITEPEHILRQIGSLLPENSRIALRIKVDGLLSTSRDHFGVILVGIDPASEKGVSFIGKGVVEGRMIRSDENSGLLVGRSLLARLDLKLGSKVVVMSQGSSGDPVSRGFRIRGIYLTERAETEKMYVFAPRASVQKMLGVGKGVTEISIDPGPALRNDDRRRTGLVDRINQQLEKVGAKYRAVDWTETLPSLHAYLKLFDGYMLVWFVVVFIAMGFGLVNTMLMAVYERMREFGLLRALGMKSGRIVKLVINETLLLLVCGTLIANGLSLLLLFLAGDGIDLAGFGQGTQMFGISRIVVPHLVTKDLLMANGVVVILGMLVGLYPALRAARFTPVETMRQL